MSGETSVENVLLKFAIDKFPEYISEIRNTYIYDAKCADAILSAPGIRATATVNWDLLKRVREFFGVKLQSELCSCLVDREMSQYFAESTFPSYFNMFSSEEYCRDAASFIRSVKEKEPARARALLASFIRHRFEFVSGIRRSYKEDSRDVSAIERLIAAVEANIVCLPQYHQNLLRAELKHDGGAGAWFAEAVLAPLVNVWFHSKESDDGLLDSLNDADNQDRIAKLFTSSDEFPAAKLPKIKVLRLEKDIYYFSMRDFHVMQKIFNQTLFTDCPFDVSQGFELLPHVRHLPADTISTDDHADDPRNNFDSWMREKALDIRLLKESAKCAKEWLSLVSKRFRPVSDTNI